MNKLIIQDIDKYHHGILKSSKQKLLIRMFN